MNVYRYSALFIFSMLLSCSDNSTDNPPLNSPNLIIKLKFDPDQERLGNLGQPVSVPIGNAAQTPTINRMSANYIEFAPSATTALGTGEVIFEGDETTDGGTQAINFQNAVFAGNNDTFLIVPLSEVSIGNYEWVRVSLAYQEGGIDLRVNGLDISGTLGSFVGYNSYITSFNLNGNIIDVNANKEQGFWVFEALGFTTQGQAPEGATTVSNPLFATSPIPQGSCVVTGEFENGFTITGNETQDITVTLSFSINDSFEWTEVNADGKYEPEVGEQVVDMGLRGLIPLVSNSP
ncbi:hypothetical protein SAMN04515667_0401 [Formosa sp. Hel1_31_208]|uniref:hypothetical protein n=1 Tax=Formosa sp. Hel1_31_208 TaxID=1798225 RepID=UPI00087A8A39|nr:hypothetical protein [Formosa sp. Hel1_31_208]SDR71110.1 hypothetical protein SAMN04515667_0401 [Formosa sp. Hel1_31_208]